MSASVWPLPSPRKLDRLPRTPKHDEATELRAIPVRGLPDIVRGDALDCLLLDALRSQRIRFQPGDILVIKHKIVSKAEGRIVPLASVKPSARARAWARKHQLDSRVIELALREAARIVRMKNGVLITETRHGFVCANSGVDVSNVDGGASAVLLPRDPDASAQKLYRALRRQLGFGVPVIIADSFGRPWREGLTEVAIGAAGLRVTRDYRGRTDAHGYRLHATLEAVADELACIAGLACGKLSRAPACIIRGFACEPARGRARDLVRPATRDLFR
jgi:coenzyme F420-0:L-glutamate ligase / coenzyme F420-1:gamma-L-glutamate ligase